ncbi:MAG: Re/Si-specific NAD(P)(+) transhydrogenase subunit alpha [Nitratireductor sp.]|nr:Re/Si-specific NAD(P)(+) transhydrogenase subunit alpha [Nitratireductor sp.]
MKLFVPKEKSPETRVALSPDTVKRLSGLGFDVTFEKGAGELSRITDEALTAAGAKVATAKDAGTADVVLKVNRPTAAEAKGYRKGALVLAAMDPHGHESDIKALAAAGISAFAMEFMPRITRAQSMDILSSQANLAGYQAVIEGAAVFDRALPMMMTAAGTVPAARVFVMGAGVAGLQAIATARRLGAVVTATDVRAAAGEQVESLGAKFIMTDALKDASGEGGYARELTADEQKAQAELVASHIAKQDIVITTALIPGRPAPKLVTKAMLANMAPGSVVVDLAVERGGNVEGSKPGEIARVGHVSVVGYENMAGRLAATASQLYAKNLVAFLETMVDGESKKLNVNPEDELVAATLLTHGGKVVHPLFAKEPAAKPAAKASAKPAAKAPARKKPAATASKGAKS